MAYSQISAVEMMLKNYFNAWSKLMIFSLLSLSGCDKTPQTDIDKSLLTSCHQTQSMGRLTLPAKQQAQICQMMVLKLKRQPPVYLFRDVLRLAYLIQQTGTDDSTVMTTLQIMKIVELRQQQNNDIAIQSTLDVIWKIYEDTQTHVTLNDLARALVAGKASASQFSNLDLEKISIALWQKQK